MKKGRRTHSQTDPFIWHDLL